jgi:hypothetical protein
MYDDVTEGGTRRVNIPERSWVLHVENTAHVNAFGGDHSGLVSAFVLYAAKQCLTWLTKSDK